MHISEGVLSPPVLLAGGLLTLGGIILGLKNLKNEKLPQVAVLSSAFFVASLIHVPIGPSSAHLILNGLVGILLGWCSFLAIFLGLLLQALIFQFGGLTVLGVNTFDMAFPAVICWFLFRRMIKKDNLKLSFIGGFLSGFCAVILAAIFTSTALYLTQKRFLAVAKTLIAVHLPIATIEGLITGFVVTYLLKVKPEVFYE
ncbi:MAG: cobalt transporter CbiM [Thermodesulfobacteria bacterium]|nr:cobalt transporter CbiM [Thermodesulfobacteriota bacterium]